MQTLSGLGQHDAAAVAVEKLDPELVLQRLDLTAEQRLRHGQRHGGARERAELAHGDEHPHLLQVHRARSQDAAWVGERSASGARLVSRRWAIMAGEVL